MRLRLSAAHRAGDFWSMGLDSINSDPVGQDRDEAQRRKEVLRELYIARGDAAEVLEPSKAALDDIAVLIGFLVVPDARLAVGFARDDGTYFLLFEKGAKRIRVIAIAGQKFLDAGDHADAFLCRDTAGGVARRQDQHSRASILTDDRVDFAVAAALGEPDRLEFGPPLTISLGYGPVVHQPCRGVDFGMNLRRGGSE
jgi:hypothetical protein